METNYLTNYELLFNFEVDVTSPNQYNEIIRKYYLFSNF